MAKDAESLIDVLTKPFTDAQVAEIDEKIAKLEAEIAERRHRIEALSHIKRFDDIRKNGKPARKKAEPKKERESGTSAAPSTSPNSTARDAAIHAFLLKNGPQTYGAIADACNIPRGSMAAQMQRLESLDRVVRCQEGYKAI